MKATTWTELAARAQAGQNLPIDRLARGETITRAELNSMITVLGTVEGFRNISREDLKILVRATIAAGKVVG
jgi:hypothetical protein